MKLVELNIEEVRSLKIASFQRETNKSKVNDLVRFYEKKGFFDSMPILINENHIVIDGGHRIKAYLKAFDNGNMKDGVFALIKDKANKETFLSVNRGTPVNINHKVKIHSKAEFLLKRGFPFSAKTSPNTISYVDFARALFLFQRKEDNLSIKQSNQKEIFSMLNKINHNELIEKSSVIQSVHDKYFLALSKEVNKKYLQKLFLYFVWLELTQKNVNMKIYDKVVRRFPLSLGGDIGVSFNKILFIDAFNFNLKSKDNLLTIEKFN